MNKLNKLIVTNFEKNFEITNVSIKDYNEIITLLNRLESHYKFNNLTSLEKFISSGIRFTDLNMIDPTKFWKLLNVRKIKETPFFKRF